MSNGLCTKCRRRPQYVTIGGHKNGYCFDCKKEQTEQLRTIKEANDYNKRLAEQHGVCAICHERPAEGQRLDFDHNHTTLKFRGLLCGSCNRALGLFKDNIRLLAAAIVYLQDNDDLDQFLRDDAKAQSWLQK